MLPLILASQRWGISTASAVSFTANDCLDIGSDLGSPVSLDYFDKAPFAFNGTIGTTTIKYPVASAR